MGPSRVRVCASRGIPALSLTILLCCGLAASAQPASVQVAIDLPDYDLVYLSEVLASAALQSPVLLPEVSWRVSVVDPAAEVDLYQRARVYVEFRDTGTPQLLSERRTRPFRLTGTRVYTPADLRDRTNNIEYAFEDAALRQRIEDHAKDVPTAPVGAYILEIAVFAAGAGSTPLATDQKRLELLYASPEEAQVHLLDPAPGALVADLRPTFSWLTRDPSAHVRLLLFEQRPGHQSLEEAARGVPLLSVDLQSASTFTYPLHPERLLLPGRTYVWYVEALVPTNRGTQSRRSEVWWFRVPDSGAELPGATVDGWDPAQARGEQTGAAVAAAGTAAADHSWEAVLGLLYGLGGDVPPTVDGLLRQDWQASGRVRLDGSGLTYPQLVDLLQRLGATGTRVRALVQAE